MLQIYFPFWLIANSVYVYNQVECKYLIGYKTHISIQDVQKNGTKAGYGACKWQAIIPAEPTL